MRGAGAKRPTSAPVVSVKTDRNDQRVSKSAFASPTNGEEDLGSPGGLDALKAEIKAKSDAAKEREEMIEAKKIADMLKQYMTQLGAQKTYQEQTKKLIQTEKKKAKLARKRIEQTKKQEAEFRRRMAIEKRKKAHALVQKKLEAEKMMEQKNLHIEEARLARLEQIRAQQERDNEIRAQKEQMRVAKLEEEERERREQFNRSQELSKQTLERVLACNEKARKKSVEERAAKRVVRQRRRVEIMEQKESEIERRRTESVEKAEHAVQVKEQIDAQTREQLRKMGEAEEAKMEVTRKRKVQQEMRRQRIRDRAYKLSESKIEDALHRLEFKKKTFCSKVGSRMEQKHRAAELRRRKMAKARAEDVERRREHFQHKLQRAKSVIEFRKEVADVRAREVAKQSLRKQQFFDVMEKLGRSHTGFEKLMALGYDLDNPDPKKLNIDNLIKLLKGEDE